MRCVPAPRVRAVESWVVRRNGVLSGYRWGVTRELPGRPVGAWARPSPCRRATAITAGWMIADRLLAGRGSKLSGIGTAMHREDADLHGVPGLAPLLLCPKSA